MSGKRQPRGRGRPQRQQPPNPLQPSSSSQPPSLPGSLGQSTSPISPYQPFLQPGQPPSQSPQPPQQGPKVAIPRLPRQESGRDAAASPVDRSRIGHACEPCRQRKTKCTGERPVCSHCRDFKISCYYGDSKRDRAKREMEDLMDRVRKYETLLSQIGPQLDSATQLLIQKTVEKSPTLEDFTPDGPPPPSRTASQSRNPPHSVSSGGEEDVSGGVGSLGGGDRVRHDFADASGQWSYMGKNTEVRWLQGAADSMRAERGIDPSSGKTLGDRERPLMVDPALGGSVSSLTRDTLTGQTEYMGLPVEGSIPSDILLDIDTYHLDDIDLSVIGDEVDPFGLPPKHVADHLIQSYFTTVHPCFPIVFRPLFTSQYEMFFQDHFPPDSNHKWLALLNLIFAVGAVHAHLVGADWAGDERDHLQYFARAQILHLDRSSVLGKSNLQQVQLLGVASIYLACSNQTNTAWNAIGLCVRYAQSSGMHLRNEAPAVAPVQKEIRARIWHAVSSLERLLAGQTGRPTSIQRKDCSVPLPSLVDEFDLPVGSERVTHDLAEPYFTAAEEATAAPSIPGRSGLVSQATSTPTFTSSGRSDSGSRGTGSSSTARVVNSAAFFVELCKLNDINFEALSLYSASWMGADWSEVEKQVESLDQRLQNWRKALPGLFDFRKRQRDKVWFRERTVQAIQFWNIRININRPCLCRFDQIPHESQKSKAARQAGAARCVEAARETIALIPDEPNPKFLDNLPWIAHLHYFMQAGTILVLEMVYRADHAPNEADGILKDAKKVVNWLHVLSANSRAARRSWSTLMRFLQIAAPMIGRDADDMPTTSLGPRPREDVPRIVDYPPSLGLGSQFARQQRLWQEFKGFEGGILQSHAKPAGSFPLITSYDQMMPDVPAYDFPNTFGTTDFLSNPEFSEVSRIFPTPRQMEALASTTGASSSSVQAHAGPQRKPEGEEGDDELWDI